MCQSVSECGARAQGRAETGQREGERDLITNQAKSVSQSIMPILELIFITFDCSTSLIIFMMCTELIFMDLN